MSVRVQAEAALRVSWQCWLLPVMGLGARLAVARRWLLLPQMMGWSRREALTQATRTRGWREQTQTPHPRTHLYH